MSKTTDIKRSFLRYAIVATALLLVFLFVKKDNIARWVQAGFTIRKQEKQIEMLRQENSELDHQIENLSSDRDSLETYAREEYFFARPGEDVYIVE